MRPGPRVLTLQVAGALSLAAVVVEAALRLTPHTKSLLVDAVPFTVWLLTGAVAAAKRPENRAVRRLAAVGLALLASLALDELPVPAHWLGQLAGYLALACWVALCAVFPDGSHSGRFSRAVVLVAFVGAAVISAVEVVTRRDVVVQVAFLAAGLCLLAVRYRGAAPEARRQIRWPLASLLLAVLYFAVGVVVPRPSAGWLADAGFIVFFSLIPVSIAVGIVRYRLFDIDQLIRGSLLYAALWALIGAAYLGAAGALGIATGRSSNITAVAVALIAVVVFLPARRFLERAARRRIRGQRLTQAQVLAQLGDVLERTTEPRGLAAAAAALIQQAIGARWVSILDTEHGTEAGVGRRPAGPAALTVTGEATYSPRVVIEAGPPRRGNYGGAEEALVRALAPHIATAIGNARLVEELRASRARIVAAENSGRQQLERDLHDGVQQQLVALGLKAGLARLHADRDQPAVTDTLAELQRDIERTLSDLRELTQGIYPISLTVGGLAPALRERISRLSGTVQLDAAAEVHDLRLPPAVEAAAYFFACEGITNALKHAPGSPVTVRLRTVGSELQLEVHDRGPGAAPGQVDGSGISGLRDRIGGVGGRVSLTSTPGEGTTLRAAIPLD